MTAHDTRAIARATPRAVDASKGLRPSAIGREAMLPPPTQAEQVAQLAREIDHRLWVLASVTPCSEAVTARHLRLHGLAVYQPTRDVERRVSRHSRRVRTVSVSPLPGYLLVGLEPDAPEWHRLFGAPHVRGVIGSPESARRLGHVIATWCAGLSDRAAEFEGARHAAPEVGALVEIGVGPWAGVRGRLVALDRRECRVLAQFFGAEREVVAALAGVTEVKA